MRYGVLSLLCVATVIAYVQRAAITVPSKTIETELGIGPAAMGVVMSTWYWGYALCQLPAGWLADRWGSRSALVVFAVLWSLLTGVVGLATGLPGLLLLWGAMGCAQAGIFPCATKAIGTLFPATQRAFASGMLACCMALGAAIAPALTAKLLGPLGLSWQAIFALYAIPGLIWAAVFAARVPPLEQPPPSQEEPDDWAMPPPPPAEEPIRWTKLVTDGHMVLLCVQQLLRAGATAFFFTWFPRFLQETKGVELADAGTLAAWPCVGGMLGGLLGGVISDWLLKRTGNARLSRQGLAVVAMIACATVALTAYFVSDPRTAVLLISVGAFFGYIGGVAAYATAIAMGGRRVAIVFATMNMSGNIGAALFPMAVGWIVAGTGNWNLALLLFASLFALAAVCWAVLNPKGTLFGGDDERS
jgi:MFS family permease